MSWSIRPVIIGQFGPPTLVCIRSWGKQGFPVGMVCVGSSAKVYPQSKYLTDFINLPFRALYKANGLQAIIDFLRKFQASGLICIDEKIALWLNDHRQLIPSEVEIWLPPNGTIKDLLSKKRQIEIARSVGFNLLPTYLIDLDGKSVSSIAPEHFPLCLRPAEVGTVRPSFKVRLINTHEELKKFIVSLEKVEKPIIAQPFMNLPNLVVHGARTVSGKSIGLQAFLVKWKFEGVTLTIRPTALDNDLREKCIEFTNQFNVTGNYHFEFLIDRNNEKIYFLELNSRLGGTTAKVYACGYNEPLFLLQSYGIEAKDRAKVRDVTVSSKLALMKYLYYTLKNRLTPLDYPVEPKLIRLLKTVYGLLAYRDDVFSFRDLRGSFALYWGNIRSKGKTRGY